MKLICWKDAKKTKPPTGERVIILGYSRQFRISFVDFGTWFGDAWDEDRNSDNDIKWWSEVPE